MDYKFKAYEKITRSEKKRAEGFELIKEYEDFYLYGKYKDGELLYRECFSKFDIDGVSAKYSGQGARKGVRQYRECPHQRHYVT